MDSNDILKGLADNELLQAAFKALLLEQFELGALEYTDTDEVLGQVVRAHLVAVAGVEAAFKQLEKYKTPLSTRVPLARHR